MRFGPCIVVAFLALVSVAAKADTSSYPVSGSGATGFTGSADVNATDDGGGQFMIVGIAGTAGYGLGVTGLIDPGGFGNGNGQYNDNLLFPDSATQVVDANGFAFTDTEGDTDFDVNVYSTGDGDYAAYLLDSDGFSEQLPVTLDVSVVEADPLFSIAFKGVPAAATTPEPSSLALLETGILGLAGVLRRRMRA